ncbi:MAG: hypothetical protein IIX44_07480 [Clostridia bacterium]|nr:hypothetical protein [Clostridia bacterium]
MFSGIHDRPRRPRMKPAGAVKRIIKALHVSVTFAFVVCNYYFASDGKIFKLSYFCLTKKREVFVHLFQKGMLAFGKLRLCLVGSRLHFPSENRQSRAS